MKRNFELIRELLFYFENKEDSQMVETPEIPEFDDLVINYHCRLLFDAGFLRCEAIRSSTSDRVIRVVCFELTWEGHEFLDRIRSNTTWNKVKSYAKDKGLSLTFSVVTGITQKFFLEAMA
ncbi:DUF2513 domain-containing protein [Vibrio parahaemolyticus]|nr:DUF2513 domain-containing protein [Vibrio parahaemolyticus]EJG0660257.1 DUF2513 domain-containing protein [Vibrio parahaemolyticus]